MIGPEALAHVAGRTVMDMADPIDRHFERISRDLREDRFDALPHRGRAEIDRKRPVVINFEPRCFLWAGGAALDETRNAKAMISAVDQSTALLRLLVPADFLEALIECSPVFAAVVLILGIGRLHMRD